jgi:MFS transporter, PHS family, inorganic phosphate transporter
MSSYGTIYSVPIQRMENDDHRDDDEENAALGSSSTSATSSLDESSRLLESETSSPPFAAAAASSSMLLCDTIFRGLGLEGNPLRADATNKRNSVSADLLLSMLSNFSTAYNVLNISLVLPLLMKCNNDEHQSQLLLDSNDIAEQQEPGNAASLCSSALIAGMIVGQITLGTLGDVVGRHRAMAVVMLLQVGAAILSAFSMRVTIGSHSEISVYQMLAFFRFLLGLGCGGVYPLSATMTSESSSVSNTDKSKLLALAFSFQGLGYLAVPAITLLVLSVLSENSAIAWRFLLALGSLPGAILSILRLQKQTSRTFRRSIASDLPSITDSLRTHHQELDIIKESIPEVHVVPVSILDTVLMEPRLVRKLVGTAGTWMLFDVLFYGNTLFQPFVLQAAFGDTETVAKAARDQMILALLALPGYYVTIFAIGRQGLRWIQIQGFFFMGILYLCVGILFNVLASHWIALLALYGSTFFFSNYGPNSVTFMLPSMTFSKSCRSTLNGISAAAGKVGALIGATVFVSALEHLGQETVFICCGVLSYAGCFLTLFCVSSKIGAADVDKIEYLSRTEKKQLQSRRDRVPMKVVWSRPSLIDSNPDQE